MYEHDKFILSINEAYKNYIKYGKRSSKKVSPIHNYIANVLSDMFGDEYTVYCADRNNEYKVDGKYYNKNIDITLVKDDEPIFCIGVKFITSNFKQNANNYFESMVGETANIQTNNSIPYAHIIILRRETPYFDNLGNIKKNEVITERDMSKYVKLMFDANHFHKPFGIGICIVDEKDGEMFECNYEDNFDENISKILTITLSNKRLFDNIAERKMFLNFKN